MAVTFKQVSAFVLGFPGVVEHPSYEGLKAFRTKKRGIVYERPNAGEVAIRTPYEVRDALCATHPDAFFLTEHFRNSQYVLVRLKAVSRVLLFELIEDAWRDAATKKQVAEWEVSR